MADDLTLIVGELRGATTQILDRLDRQDRQHEIDKAEAISERDRRHTENTGRLDLLNQKLNDAAVLAAHSRDWIAAIGDPMQARVTQLEKNRADLEKKNAAERGFSKGAAVVWGGIVAAVGTAITLATTLGMDGIKAVLHAVGFR